MSAGVFLMPKYLFPLNKNCTKVQYQSESDKLIFEYIKLWNWQASLLVVPVKK